LVPSYSAAKRAQRTGESNLILTGILDPLINHAYQQPTTTWNSVLLVGSLENKSFKEVGLGSLGAELASPDIGYLIGVCILV
jgi:hypothetical protein